MRGTCTDTNCCSSITGSPDGVCSETCTLVQGSTGSQDGVDTIEACVAAFAAFDLAVAGTMIRKYSYTGGVFCALYSGCDPLRVPAGSANDKYQLYNKVAGMVECAGGVTCTPGTCESSSVCADGACVITYENAETACNDGDVNTSDDQCDGSGGCAGTGRWPHNITLNHA